MHIAVISDVHANVFALSAIYSDLQRRKVDEIAFLGDLVMTGPRPQESFSLMQKIGPAIWLKGNTDEWLAEIDDKFVPKNEKEAKIVELNEYARVRLAENEIAKLVSGNISKEVEIEGHKIVFCHGSPASVSQGLLMGMSQMELEEAVKETGASLIICGHTHIPTNMKSGIKTVLNFGSASMPGNDKSKNARYGLMNINREMAKFEFREVEYDFSGFVNDMKDLDFPGFELVMSKY